MAISTSQDPRKIYFNPHFQPHIYTFLKDKYGWTPLHCAAYHGSIECAKRLIKLGAIVEHRNRVGKTALHLSGSMGRKSMCDLLLEYGGNLNTQVTYTFLVCLFVRLFIHLFIYFCFKKMACYVLNKI